MKNQPRKRTITGLVLGLQLVALFVLDGAVSRLAAAEPLQWIGATSQTPANGELDTGEDLWIDSQTWPAGSASVVHVVYSVDGGSTWSVAALSANGQAGNNDSWHANLGTFPAATGIQYAVVATDAEGSEMWDNNGGGNYTALVAPLQIVQTPENGSLTRHDDLVIVFDAPGAGSGFASVEVFYTLDDTNWFNAPMVLATQADYDHWEANLGKFLDATILHYVLAGIDAEGHWHWFDNGGENYTAIVNGEFENQVPFPVQSNHATASYESWSQDPSDAFDHLKTAWSSWNTSAGKANSEESVCWVAYDFGVPTRIDQYMIRAYSPKDFELQGSNGGEWVTLDVRYGETGWDGVRARSYDVYNRGEYTNYRLLITDDDDPYYTTPFVQITELELRRAPEVLVGHTPANGVLTCGDDVVIAFDAAGTARGYTLVEVVYSKDGLNWFAAPMALTPETGYDHWEVNLGQFVGAPEIQYALVATDAEGNQQWFSNGGKNYTAYLAGAYVNQVNPLSGPSESVTGNRTYSFYPEWYAFDGSDETSCGATTKLDDPAWIAYEFTEATRVDRYKVAFNNLNGVGSEWTRDFELQGSNGGEWVTLDTRTGETGWAVPEKRAYRVANPGVYSQYRLVFFTDRYGIYGSGRHISIAELELEQLTDVNCSN